MEVEFTARQVKVTKALRTQAEEALERIARILGRTARASIVFSAQKYLQIAELTIKARQKTIAATGKGDTLTAALKQALEHAENQARKSRDRKMGAKRLPKEEKVLTAPPVSRPKARAPEPELPPEGGEAARPRASIAVHSFPVGKTVVEPHILASAEAFAFRPLTVEEAVKEAEFRDRDLLIFHNPAGQLYVLHRRRDGQMELVEMP
jgi:putative sigma-54 modulation protein